MSIKQISAKIKSALSGEPYILAIFHNGSYVVGTNTDKSDIDFTIIVKTRKDIAKAISKLKKSLKFIGIDHDVHFYSANFDRKGRKIGVCVFDKRTMDFFVRVLYSNTKDFTKWQAVAQHKIVEAEAVYDPNKLLESYKARIDSISHKIFEGVFRNSMKELKFIYKDWVECGFRNEFNFSHDLPDILRNICLALYAKNRRLLMPPFKRLHKDLDELKPDIRKEMYFLVRGSNSAKNLEEKRLALKEIMEKLGK